MLSRVCYPFRMLWNFFPKMVRTSDIEHWVSLLHDYRDTRIKKYVLPIGERFADHMRDLLFILTSPDAVMVYGLATNGLYAGDETRETIGMSQAKDLEYAWLQMNLPGSLSAWLLANKREPDTFQQRIVEVMREKKWPESLERSISRSVILLAWSAYEAMAGDLWATFINVAPHILLPRALGRGINMKTLKMVCINAEDAIGQSLQRRMNMTSVTEIREAFERIFSPGVLPFLSIPDNQ